MTTEGKAWFDSRPPQIQALVREFPPGTILNVQGDRMHVVAFTESDNGEPVGLEVSAIDPHVDYDGAVDAL